MAPEAGSLQASLAEENKRIEHQLKELEKLSTKGSRKNNFTEWALGFGSDLADPIEQNRRHSRLCRGFASEVSGKDGRKPRWQNVKLFLREP